MKLCGVCIITNNAPRLATFYATVLQEQPGVDGNHYGFDNAQLAVYDPGNVSVVNEKNMSIMFYVDNVQREYERLLKEIPCISIASPPECRPWGAFSFWFLDPDGNTVSFIEQKGV